jgi:stage III sporulation protein AD
MFNVFGLFGLVTVCGILVVTIKKHSPEHAFAISLGCVCVTAVYLLSQITSAVSEISDIAGGAAVAGLDSLFKAVGIGIVGQIMADVCNDYGQASLAGVISVAGRFAIVIISLPLFRELLSIAVGLVNS